MTTFTTAALIVAAELYAYRRECFADSNEGMCAFHLFQDVITRLAAIEQQNAIIEDKE